MADAVAAEKKRNPPLTSPVNGLHHPCWIKASCPLPLPAAVVQQVIFLSLSLFVTPNLLNLVVTLENLTPETTMIPAVS